MIQQELISLEHFKETFLTLQLVCVKFHSYQSFCSYRLSSYWFIRSLHPRSLIIHLSMSEYVKFPLNSITFIYFMFCCFFFHVFSATLNGFHIKTFSLRYTWIGIVAKLLNIVETKGKFYKKLLVWENKNVFSSFLF